MKTDGVGWMSIKRMLLMLFIAPFCGAGAESENLLPPLTSQTGPGDFWIQAKTAEAQAKFSTAERENTKYLKVEVKSDSGYAFWRTWKSLAPGVYTGTVACDGYSRDPRGIKFEIYSFDKNGTPSLICSRAVNSESSLAKRIGQTFTVPGNSVKVRIDAGLVGYGSAAFSRVEICKGNTRLATGEDSVPVDLPLKNWIADWLWVKGFKEAPRAIFSKKIELEDAPACALFQITADNGYSLTINGVIASSDMNWKSIKKVDATALMKKGVNSIAIDTVNFDGPGGCIMQGHIWDYSGRMQTLKTDATWTVEVPGASNSIVSDALGIPPVNPWGKIECLPLSLPAELALESISASTSIVAGDIFSIHLKYRGNMPASGINDLKIVFHDIKGNRVALSAYEPIVRCENNLKLIAIELPTSRLAPAGSYSWKLEGASVDLNKLNGDKFLEVSLSTDLVRQAAASFPKKPGNKMRTAGGWQSPFTYATVTPSIQSFVNWTRTGGHMYEIYMPAGYRLPDGTVDLSQVEKELMQILEADPNASVYVKLRIDEPGWWVQKHQEETFFSNRNRRGLQSFCSKAWREDTMEFVNKTLLELEQTPSGNAIAGVILMAFRGGEFQLWGEDIGEYDCSQAAKTAFSAWQKSNGISPEITLPHPALEWPFVSGSGYDTIRCAFFRFLAERNAENVMYFASEFKRTYGSKYSFGIYYGYAMEHCGSLKRMLYGGHLGVAKVLREAPIDVITCPASYGLRRMEQSHAYMIPVDSALMHGIMPIIENDIRNYVVPYLKDGSGPTLLTLDESIKTNRKLNMLAASHGAAVRYLALLEGFDFFASYPMIDSIASDNRLVMELTPAPLGMKGQIAMVMDPLTWTACATPGFDESKIRGIGELRDVLMRTGRSSVFITFDDWLEKSSLWETLVVPLPGLLPRDRLKCLVDEFGSLPEVKSYDNLLLLRKGSQPIITDVKSIRLELALPESAAKPGNVWYVGGNFRAIWDGASIDVQMQR